MDLDLDRLVWLVKDEGDSVPLRVNAGEVRALLAAAQEAKELRAENEKLRSVMHVVAKEAATAGVDKAMAGLEPLFTQAVEKAAEQLAAPLRARVAGMEKWIGLAKMGVGSLIFSDGIERMWYDAALAGIPPPERSFTVLLEDAKETKA